MTADMVKTRLQSGAGYKGPVDAAKAILKNEGVGGFYRGACRSLSIRLYILGGVWWLYIYTLGGV